MGTGASKRRSGKSRGRGNGEMTSHFEAVSTPRCGLSLALRTEAPFRRPAPFAVLCVPAGHALPPGAEGLLCTATGRPKSISGRPGAKSTGIWTSHRKAQKHFGQARARNRPFCTAATENKERFHRATRRPNQSRACEDVVARNLANSKTWALRPVCRCRKFSAHAFFCPLRRCRARSGGPRTDSAMLRAVMAASTSVTTFLASCSQRWSVAQPAAGVAALTAHRLRERSRRIS